MPEAAPAPSLPPADPAGQTLLRVRVAYAKSEPLRYTGNLDVQHVWERLLRRSRLPAAYSQGFHPQARLSQACALPLGFTSRCEVLDLWLERPLPLGEIEAALQRAAPPGIHIQGLEEIPLREPAVQTQVISSEYEAALLDLSPALDLPAQVEALLASAGLPRVWKGKAYDLRPLVEELRLLEAEDGRPPRLFMRLAAREGATGRPEEVLGALGLDPYATRVVRTRLIFG